MTGRVASFSVPEFAPRAGCGGDGESTRAAVRSASRSDRMADIWRNSSCCSSSMQRMSIAVSEQPLCAGGDEDGDVASGGGTGSTGSGVIKGARAGMSSSTRSTRTLSALAVRACCSWSDRPSEKLACISWRICRDSLFVSRARTSCTRSAIEASIASSRRSSGALADERSEIGVLPTCGSLAVCTGHADGGKLAGAPEGVAQRLRGASVACATSS